MGTVYWTEFDWPSFATIFTGLIAVVGAVLLGLRQAAITLRQAGIAERQNEILAAQNDIAHRQNEILASQTDLALQSFRHDLFDRRISIYMEITKYIAELMAVYVEIPDERDFVLAVHKSQFLFSPPVLSQILKGYSLAEELRKLRTEHGDTSDAGNDPAQIRIYELRRELESFTTNLNQKLRPEMGIFG